jgi:hypothetical protein
MNVKGTAFLARKMLLEAEFGESVAKKYLDEAVAAVPSFPQLVLASTLIPMAPFLALQDELLRRYYDNDPMSFFRFGETSAEWALTKGPYKGLAANKDIDTFIRQGSALYKTYFDVGSASTSLEDGHVAYRIDGVPREFRHLYVEYATLGYFKHALELLGATNVEAKRIQGFSSGNANVLYEIYFRRAPASTRGA